MEYEQKSYVICRTVTSHDLEGLSDLSRSFQLLLAAHVSLKMALPFIKEMPQIRNVCLCLYAYKHIFHWQRFPLVSVPLLCCILQCSVFDT